MKKTFSIATLSLFALLAFTTQVHAESLYNYTEKVRTNLPHQVEVKVCINDTDEHMDDVEKFVLKYFEAEPTKIPLEEANIASNDNLKAFKDCDVTNYSIGILPIFFGYEDRLERLENFRTEEIKNIDNYLSTYNGIIVSAAGNENGSSSFSSPLYRYKEKNQNSTYLDRLFVVGQIEENENGEYIHHYSYGEHVDFVVPNYNENIVGHKDNFRGTSFATAVATALISQMLQAGVLKEDIRGLLGFEDKQHYWEGKSYPVLSVRKTIQNTYKYLNEKK